MLGEKGKRLASCEHVPSSTATSIQYLLNIIDPKLRPYISDVLNFHSVGGCLLQFNSIQFQLFSSFATCNWGIYLSIDRSIFDLQNGRRSGKQAGDIQRIHWWSPQRERYAIQALQNPTHPSLRISIRRSPRQESLSLLWPLHARSHAWFPRLLHSPLRSFQR